MTQSCAEENLVRIYWRSAVRELSDQQALQRFGRRSRESGRTQTKHVGRRRFDRIPRVDNQVGVLRHHREVEARVIRQDRDAVVSLERLRGEGFNRGDWSAARPVRLVERRHVRIAIADNRAALLQGGNDVERRRFSNIVDITFVGYACDQHA